jgi:hypothetical protein
VALQPASPARQQRPQAPHPSPLGRNDTGPLLGRNDSGSSAASTAASSAFGSAASCPTTLLGLSVRTTPTRSKSSVCVSSGGADDGGSPTSFAGAARAGGVLRSVRGVRLSRSKTMASPRVGGCIPRSPESCPSDQGRGGAPLRRPSRLGLPGLGLGLSDRRGFMYAEWHPEVTLLFADVVGFTTMCQQVRVSGTRVGEGLGLTWTVFADSWIHHHVPAGKGGLGLIWTVF